MDCQPPLCGTCVNDVMDAGPALKPEGELLRADALGAWSLGLDRAQGRRC